MFKLLIVFWITVAGILAMKNISFDDDAFNIEPQIMAEPLNYG